MVLRRREAPGVMLLLAVVLVVAGGVGPTWAQFGVMHENNTGWFYFYASGQIVVANPNSNRVFYRLRSSEATSTPFPNRCPNSTFRGAWADVTYGPGKRSLMASMAYDIPVMKRPHNFPDGILTANVSTATVNSFTQLINAPATATFVPVTDKVYLTSAGKGATTQTLGVLGTQAGGDVEQSVTLPGHGSLALFSQDGTNIAPGKLLHHFNLGRKAYLTAPVAPGVFVLDLYHKNMFPGATQDYTADFISFANIGCPATNGAVYSRVLRMAFFQCTDLPPSSLSNKLTAGRPRQGIIQLDTVTNTPTAILPYTADKLFVTPDESFLLVLNTGERTIHMLQFNVSTRSLVKWNDITWDTGYRPVDIAFTAKPPYYFAYISYLDADRVGVLDFGRVLQCGLSCSPGNSASFIQDQQQMGFQNPPGLDSGFQGAPEPHFVTQTTRAIGAGGGFVCQASVWEMAVYCYNPQVGAPIKFENISFVQHIRYVPGPLTNYTDALQRINPYFNCKSADQNSSAPGYGDQGPWSDDDDSNDACARSLLSRVLLLLFLISLLFLVQ